MQRKSDEWKALFAESVQSKSMSILQNYLNVTYFSDVWTDILKNPSQETAISEGLQFLSSYRRLAYTFKDSASLSIKLSDYNRIQIQSLVVSICVHHQNQQVVSSIIKTLPHELYSSLLDEISFENLPFVLHYMGSVWALKSLKIMLKKSTKYSNFIINIKNEHYVSAVKLYVHEALKEMDEVVVIDELALIHHGSELFATALVESFALDDHYVDIFLDRVACLWGSKLFILQGNENMQIYLTNMILQLLHKMNDISSKSRLMERGPRGNGMPLAITLSQGVSAYFDTTDSKSRNRAMTIAKLFSFKLGSEIKFSMDKNNDEAAALSSSSSKVTTSNNIINTVSATTQVQNNNQENIGEIEDRDNDDNSEFSDLEPYEILDDIDNNHQNNNNNNFLMKNKSKFQTVYLRNCLEMLQYPDSKPDAYDKHQTALMNIPSIVASSPVDGFDLAGPLTRELLRLQNAFNMENFSELQRSAIQSLLCEYPSQSIHVVTQSILSDSLSLGSKIEALTQLVCTAYVLAGMNPQSTYETTTVQGGRGGGEGNSTSMRVLKSSSSVVMNINDDNTSTIEKDNNNNNNNSIQSRTKIKRPMQLKQYHENTHHKSKSFRNKFGTVSHFFFHPVLSLLTNYLKKNQNQSSSSSSTISLVQNTTVRILDENITSDTSDKQKKQQNQQELYDDIDALLISQTILTLGAFIRCSINTPIQKHFAIETFKYAFLCKDMPSLSIRRASLSAILSSVECFLLLSKNSSSLNYRNNNSNSSRNGTSVLDELCDITSINKDSSSSSLDPQILTVISTIIEWVKMTHHVDMDLNSQILKREMMKIALQVLEI